MAIEKNKTESKKNTKGKTTTTKKNAPKTTSSATKSTSKVTSKTAKTTPKKTTSTSKNESSAKKSAPKSTTKKTTTKKSAPKTTSSATKSTSKVTSNTAKTTSKKTTAKTSSKPYSIENIEANKTKDVKTIEISQRKLIVGIIIAVLVILLCLVCFLGSNSVSKKYSTSSTNTDTPSSEGNDILEQATKEAGKISDEQREAPTDISVDDYIELYSSDDLSLVLLSKESCSYCQIAIPIIENIIYENGVKINRVDVGEMSKEDSSKLISSDEYFSEGYGTPLLMVVGENSIKDKIEGLTTKESYIEFFKKYGFME